MNRSKMREEALRADGICLEVGKRVVLENIGLHLFQGEVLGIAGTFHSGIIYLKQILQGKLIPQQGRFYVRGNQAVQPDKLSLHIGQITADSLLAEELTVAENLFLIRPHRPALVNWPSMDHYINELLATVAPEIRAGQQVSTLSVVQKKIVEIVKYALMDISVILIDDSICYTEKANSILYQSIRTFCGKGMSFLYFANHSNCFIDNADRIMIFRNSHLTGYVINDGFQQIQVKALIAPNVTEAARSGPADNAQSEKVLYRISCQHTAEWQHVCIHESEIVCFVSCDHEFIRTLEEMFENISRANTKADSARAHDTNWKLERFNRHTITFMPYNYFESIICQDLTVYDNAFLDYRAKSLRDKLTFYFKKDNYFSRQVEKVMKKPEGWARRSLSHMLPRYEQWQLMTFRNFIGDAKTIFMSYPTKESAAILQMARQKRLSVIIATDSPEDIGEICDKILVVEYGKVVKNIHQDVPGSCSSSIQGHSAK